MRQFSRFAAVSALALGVAACGGPAEEEADTGAMDETAVVDETVVDETVTDEVPADEETPAADETAAPEPTASATPTPTASATPTQAAAATPPAAFTQCRVCHSIEPGQNGIGPSLAGVFGRHSAAVSGFTYTANMQTLNVTWNEANLNRYLTNPQAMVPGTTMAIGPLDATQRTAIINYLKTL